MQIVEVERRQQRLRNLLVRLAAGLPLATVVYVASGSPALAGVAVLDLAAPRERRARGPPSAAVRDLRAASPCAAARNPVPSRPENKSGRNEMTLAEAAPAKGPLVWQDMDQAALDAAYDQTVWAPNQALTAERRSAAAAEAKARLQPTRHSYGETGIEAFDFYSLRRGARADRDLHSRRRLAKRHGRDLRASGRDVHVGRRARRHSRLHQRG